MTGVGANESLVEDAAGKLVEVIFFDGAEKAGADLGGDGDVFEGNLALLAFALQSCAEWLHSTFLLGRRDAGGTKPVRGRLFAVRPVHIIGQEFVVRSRILSSR